MNILTMEVTISLETFTVKIILHVSSWAKMKTLNICYCKLLGPENIGSNFKVVKIWSKYLVEKISLYKKICFTVWSYNNSKLWDEKLTCTASWNLALYRDSRSQSPFRKGTQKVEEHCVHTRCIKLVSSRLISKPVSNRFTFDIVHTHTLNHLIYSQ